jgi:hypothetical protein
MVMIWPLEVAPNAAQQRRQRMQVRNVFMTSPFLMKND